MHFVISHDFRIPSEVERYGAFMDAVCDMVVKKYDGSLKAEHGTGRNMAPFVELEWGAAAYQLMVEIKSLLDPECLLNPGVRAQRRSHGAHLKNLKPMPAADAAGRRLHGMRLLRAAFARRNGLTLTPRQRIVGWRENDPHGGDGRESGTRGRSP